MKPVNAVDEVRGISKAALTCLNFAGGEFFREGTFTFLENLT